ncbi:unnamed protein product [Mytilus coruscus]|uniref:Uncharacterized protein n=1 Tax=Mytilus coruscus TaxID=42192 RepID=A0A6J7ZX22_MYTCO|nr:unnamed protein product [Mytilus coruscus]
MKELMAAEQTESRKLQKLLATLKTKETEITEYQTNICNIKQHASELQTFMAIKHIEKDLKVEEKFIRSIAESDITNQVNISYQVNNSLQQITDSLQKFGEIDVSSELFDFPIQKRKDRQAQIIVALPARNIDNLILTLQKRIKTYLSNTSGCSMLPDGRIIFSCYVQKKRRVFKSDGSEDFGINNIGNTFDVVFIGDDCIAVTSGCSKPIKIIDIKKNKLKKKTIEMNSQNDGVVYKDGHLIYCAGKKGLQWLVLVMNP